MLFMKEEQTIKTFKVYKMIFTKRQSSIIKDNYQKHTSQTNDPHISKKVRLFSI